MMQLSLGWGVLGEGYRHMQGELKLIQSSCLRILSEASPHRPDPIVSGGEEHFLGV